MNKEQKAGLYVHVPFCNKKCNYCDFYSLTASDDLKKAYTDALVNDIKQKSKLHKSMCFDSIYFGGGTPSVLPQSLLERIIRALHDSFNIEKGCEFTLETNPGIDCDLAFLRKLGVNRLSIGLQSANFDELKLLGRIHTVEDFKKTFESARKANFDNISVDIMFSLPSQTREKLMNTLSLVTSLSPEHISAYSLKIEEGTPFYKMRDSLNLPDEDADADMYLLIGEFLAKNGYTGYEISNFAKKGRESLHNLKYWTHADYLGFGPGAHSFVSLSRYAYARDINAYINAFLNGKDVIYSEKYDVNEKEYEREALMLGLRLADGVSDALLSKFGMLENIYARLAPLVSAGLVTKTKNGIGLSARGMYVSNSIINLIEQ